MKRHRFDSREESRQEAAEKLVQGQPLQFASPEEMIRHDRLRTPVPPGIEERLRESASALPPRRVPWWRRLFGG